MVVTALAENSVEIKPDKATAKDVFGAFSQH